MENANKKSLSDYAKTLFNKQYPQRLSAVEIEQQLKYMINNKGTGRNWYKTAVFIYYCGSYKFTKVLKVFMEATGYERTALYNFRKAGEVIHCEKILEQDVGDKTVNEFLGLVKKTTSGCIIKVKKIGSYILDKNSFHSGEYYLYQGEFEKRKIYFHSDVIIDGNIEVRVSTEKDRSGKMQEHEVKVFIYNNEIIQLSYFEPLRHKDVNLKRS